MVCAGIVPAASAAATAVGVGRVVVVGRLELKRKVVRGRVACIHEDFGN